MVETALSQVTARQLLETIQSFPAGWDTLAPRILSQVETQSTDRMQLAKRALIWMASSADCLSIDCLCDALAMNTENHRIEDDRIPTPELLVVCSKSLVTIDWDSSMAFLVHEDIRAPIRRYWEKDCVEEEDMLTLVCLEYLLLDEFSTGPCRDLHSFKSRLEKHHLLEYAAVSWVGRVRERHPIPIEGLVIKLFSNYHNLLSAWQVKEYRQTPHPNFSSHAELARLTNRLTPFTPLSAAVDLNLGWVVDILLAERSRESCLGDALHLAYSKQNKALFKKVFEAGVLERSNGFGTTGVFLVITEHPSYMDFYWESRPACQSIYDAITKRDWVALEILLALKMRVGQIPDSKDAYLHFAIREKDLEALKLLLHYCGEKLYGNKDTTRLLHKETLVNALDEHGLSALHTAVQMSNIHALQLLLQAGADPNIRDIQGMTVLYFAISINASTEVVQELIEAGANSNTHGPDGRSPLHIASRRGDISLVRLLLRYGSDANVKSSLGLTPIFEAVESRNSQVVNELLSYGADMTVRSKDGKTVLHKAATQDNTEVLNTISERCSKALMSSLKIGMDEHHRIT